MNSISGLALSYVLSLTLLTQSCNAVCFDEVEEYHQCTTPPTITVNDIWYNGVTNWYIPLMNQVELYENAQLVFGREGLHNLTPLDMDRSCTYYRQMGSKEIWYSFRGHSVEFNGYPDSIRPGVTHYTTANENFRQAYIASSYTTLTDNATFLVTVCYWSDGRKGFLVGSPYKTLGFQEMRRIKRHLIQLGFRPEYFVESTYDRC